MELLPKNSMDSGLESRDLRVLADILRGLSVRGGGAFVVEFIPEPNTDADNPAGKFRFSLNGSMGESPNLHESEWGELVYTTDANLEFGLLPFIELALEKMQDRYGDPELLAEFEAEFDEADAYPDEFPDALDFGYVGE